jgi:hypothetical protein
MPVGSGKYDALCTAARQQADAEVVLLIVLNGNKGSGFSMQNRGPREFDLPGLLERVAADIRKDMEGAK